MTWRLNENNRNDHLGMFVWEGGLPETVKSRYYDKGTISEWIAFPKPTYSFIQNIKTGNQARYAEWEASELARLGPPTEPGDRIGDKNLYYKWPIRRDTSILPNLPCACCTQSIPQGDVRYTRTCSEGLCDECWMYVSGSTTRVCVRRGPTVPELLLLPEMYLSGDAVTLLRVLRAHHLALPTEASP